MLGFLMNIRHIQDALYDKNLIGKGVNLDFHEGSARLISHKLG